MRSFAEVNRDIEQLVQEIHNLETEINRSEKQNGTKTEELERLVMMKVNINMELQSIMGSIHQSLQEITAEKFVENYTQKTTEINKKYGEVGIIEQLEEEIRLRNRTLDTDNEQLTNQKKELQKKKEKLRELKMEMRQF